MHASRSLDVRPRSTISWRRPHHTRCRGRNLVLNVPKFPFFRVLPNQTNEIRTPPANSHLDKRRDCRFASPGATEKTSNITGTKFTLCRNSQKALIAQRLRTASPATLRQQAAISRELGNVDLAYYLEELANDRWREPES